MFRHPASSRHRKRRSIRRFAFCIFIAVLLAFWQCYPTLSRWRLAHSVTERLERHIEFDSGSDSQSHGTSTVLSLAQVAPHADGGDAKASWKSDGRPLARLTHNLNTTSTSRNNDRRHTSKLIFPDENGNEAGVVSSLIPQVVDSERTGLDLDHSRMHTRLSRIESIIAYRIVESMNTCSHPFYRYIRRCPGPRNTDFQLKVTATKSKKERMDSPTWWSFLSKRL